jgi:hypothetical protein
MKRAPRKARVQGKEPLVAAAQSIGSTLGLVVAKIRTARELGRKEVATLKRRPRASHKKRRKSKT